MNINVIINVKFGVIKVKIGKCLSLMFSMVFVPARVKAAFLSKMHTMIICI